MFYIVIQKPFLCDLVEEVNKKIEEGYELVGGIGYSTYGYAQAMKRKK